MSQAGPLILGIDVANPSATPADRARGFGPGVSLGEFTPEGVRVLGVEVLRSPEKRGGHDDDLLPAVERLLTRLRVPMPIAKSRALGAVAVSVGPGGYTSVRVACAAGTMLARAAGAGAIAVPTARCVLASLDAQMTANGQPVAIALASKGATCVCQVFSDGVERIGGLIDERGVAELVRLGVRRLVGDAHVPPGVRSACAQAGIEVMAPSVGPACVLLAARGLPVLGPGTLVPVYPREPDAVTLWRQRKTQPGA